MFSLLFATQKGLRRATMQKYATMKKSYFRQDSNLYVHDCGININNYVFIFLEIKTLKTHIRRYLSFLILLKRIY